MNRRLKFYRGETGIASMGLLFQSESGAFLRRTAEEAAKKRFS